MVDKNWQTAKVYTGISEGGYSDHPRDRGGPTNFGITQAVYDAYRRRKHEKPQPVALITSTERDDIFREDYWNLCGAAALPTGLDYCVFDAAIHHGVAGGVKILQTAINAKHPGTDINVDGVAGGITLDRADDLPVDAMINAACDARIEYMKTRDGWATFEDGWRKRVLDCRKNALSMIVLNPADAKVTPKPYAHTVDEPKLRNPSSDPKGQSFNHPVMWITGLFAALAAIGSFLFN